MGPLHILLLSLALTTLTSTTLGHSYTVSESNCSPTRQKYLVLPQFHVNNLASQVIPMSKYAEKMFWNCTRFNLKQLTSDLPACLSRLNRGNKAAEITGSCSTGANTTVQGQLCERGYCQNHSTLSDELCKFSGKQTCCNEDSASVLYKGET